MWNEPRNPADSAHFINAVAHILCNELTHQEMHGLIKELANRRKMVGAGYFSAEDLTAELSREHNLEELTEKDVESFLEHLHGSAVQEKITAEATYEFEVGIIAQLGLWHDDTEHLAVERHLGLRRAWHQQVQEIIELNRH